MARPACSLPLLQGSGLGLPRLLQLGSQLAVQGALVAQPLDRLLRMEARGRHVTTPGWGFLKTEA